MRLRVLVDNLDLFKTLKDPNITLKNKHKNDIWLASIEAIHNKEDADALKGQKIYCDRSNLPDLNDDEFYFADLIGLDCVDEQGTLIGVVQSVENYGAGDILDIKPPSGNSFYLSYDDQTIIDVSDTITVRMPEVI